MIRVTFSPHSTMRTKSITAVLQALTRKINLKWHNNKTHRASTMFKLRSLCPTPLCTTWSSSRRNLGIQDQTIHGHRKSKSTRTLRPRLMGTSIRITILRNAWKTAQVGLTTIEVRTPRSSASTEQAVETWTKKPFQSWGKHPWAPTVGAKMARSQAAASEETVPRAPCSWET